MLFFRQKRPLFWKKWIPLQKAWIALITFNFANVSCYHFMLDCTMGEYLEESVGEWSAASDEEGWSATSAKQNVRTRRQRCQNFLTRCTALFPERTSSDAHAADPALEEERARSFDSLLSELMHGNDSQLFYLRTHYPSEFHGFYRQPLFVGASVCWFFFLSFLAIRLVSSTALRLSAGRNSQ